MVTITEMLIPEMSALRTYLLSEESRFLARGYDITVEPGGTSTSHGYRGLIVTATSRVGARTHTMSLDSGVNVDGHHVKLLVDGQLHPQVTETLFRMPPVCATMKPVIDWFIDRHLA